MIELIKPDLVPDQQPMIIRYQGETDAGVAASEPVDIKCVYVSGLDTGLQRDFERANIVFEIHDSYLQKLEQSLTLTHLRTLIILKTVSMVNGGGYGNGFNNCTTSNYEGNIYRRVWPEYWR